MIRDRDIKPGMKLRHKGGAVVEAWGARDGLIWAKNSKGAMNAYWNDFLWEPVEGEQ